MLMSVKFSPYKYIYFLKCMTYLKLSLLIDMKDTQSSLSYIYILNMDFVFFAKPHQLIGFLSW